jgi:hypothetical protein
MCGGRRLGDQASFESGPASVAAHDRVRSGILERAPQTAILPPRLGSPAEALRGASRAPV